MICVKVWRNTFRKDVEFDCLGDCNQLQERKQKQGRVELFLLPLIDF